MDQSDLGPCKKDPSLLLAAVFFFSGYKKWQGEIEKEMGEEGKKEKETRLLGQSEKVTQNTRNP